MKTTRPYIAFALVYLAAGLALTFGLEAVEPLAGAYWIGFLTPVVSAPIAILAARRLGELSMPGLAVSALACALVVPVVTWLLLHNIAVPAGGSVSLFAFYAVGGWPYVLAAVWSVICPLVWYRVVFEGGTAPRRVAAGTL